MRFYFKFGYVRRAAAAPVSLAASSDEPAETHWIKGSLDLRTIVAVAGFVLALVAMRVDTSSRLTELATEQKRLRADVDDLRRQVSGKASRSDLAPLQETQRQFYTLLFDLRPTH